MLWKHCLPSCELFLHSLSGTSEEQKISNFFKNWETSLMVQCLRLHTSIAGAQIWSLVRELISHTYETSVRCSKCEVIPPVVLICPALMVSNIEFFFHPPVAHLFVFFGKMSVQTIRLLFDQVINFFSIELQMFLIHFRDYPHRRYVLCKYFLQLHVLPFYFVDCSFCCEETF